MWRGSHQRRRQQWRSISHHGGEKAKQLISKK